MTVQQKVTEFRKKHSTALYNPVWKERIELTALTLLVKSEALAHGIERIVSSYESGNYKKIRAVSMSEFTLENLECSPLRSRYSDGNCSG